jgi:hypothetical protein
MRKYMVGIYEEDGAGLLVHVVDTISQASAWVGVSVDAFYKSLHLTGTMNARGYVLELIKNEEGEDSEE